MVDGAIQLFLQSKKLYSNKEDQVAALKRHMEFLTLTLMCQVQ